MADVSVIIPAYNRLWSLPQAIESCRHTHCSTEIIVIDDGSTDGTWEWLQEQTGIIALTQTNWGKCWAVNKGFGIATGKYIRFLDSDDMLTKGAIDEQFQIAQKNESDIVVSGYALIDKDGNLLSNQKWINCDDFVAQQLGECDSSHYSAYLFKKSFIEDIPHRPDYAYRDDRMFVLEAALKYPKVNVHEGIALQHRQHEAFRLQRTYGMKYTTQNYQHLNIYKKILGQLAASGMLTTRRIKASINPLWNLCKWIAIDNTTEASMLFNWIKELDPEFIIPEKGVRGFLYQNLGVTNTHKLLQLGRTIKSNL
ncbi:MAG: glycosyltransferase family 2 protein [Mucilaginibacter sp.]